jgi:hypothetical protein
MNSVLQDSSTGEPSGLYPRTLSADTSRDIWPAGGAVAEYSIQSEASSAFPLRSRSATRGATENDFEGSSAGIMYWMLGRAHESGDQTLASPSLERNERAISLLESWLAVPKSDEGNERLKAFVTALDEDRLSERKLFP